VLQGKRLVFVTNNSTKSRKQYGKKFETLGLTVNEVPFGVPPHELSCLDQLLLPDYDVPISSSKSLSL
jgi:hypothetical protein